MAKKVFLIGILIVSTMLVSAQCVEVKGVTFKQECYKNCNSDDEVWGNENHWKYPEWGIRFTNVNNYQVTVEAEKWEKESASLDNTITFTLEAGRSYLWKCNDYVNLPMKGCDYYATLRDYYKYHYNNFYIKFKAFKCPE